MQLSRLDEAQKKVEGLQNTMEQRDTTIRGLELTHDDLRKQLDLKKKQLIKMTTTDVINKQTKQAHMHEDQKILKKCTIDN